MSYHAGGVRVREQASWAGLGWTLQAGGAVSRMVQGRKDEDSVEGWYYKAQLIPDPNGDPCTFFNYSTSNLHDSEPDIFSFSFPGGSGKFFFDKFQKPVLVPLQDIKIVPLFTTNQTDLKHLKGFNVITSDGTIYQFGDNGDGNPAIETTSAGGGNYPEIPSSWFLKKILSYDGMFFINFSYDDEDFQQKNVPSYSGCPSNNFMPNFQSNNSTVQSKRLTSISTDLETVSFIATNQRQDLDEHPLAGTYPAKKPKELNSITIRQGTSTVFYKRL
ncbi:MAG: hypothetical protein IT258_00965, partial [Saprospiraceae bacterium]|nr:hypothetical protein [Saprospiraceae bacterium]